MLLSLTLLFSGFTAALSMFMNMPPMTYMISVIGGMVIAMFVLPRFANSTAGIGIVFLITGMLGFGLGPMLTMYASLPNGGNIITLSLGAQESYSWDCQHMRWLLERFQFSWRILDGGFLVGVIGCTGKYFLTDTGYVIDDFRCCHHDYERLHSV